MAKAGKAPFRFWSFFFSLKGRVSRWPYVACEGVSRLSLLGGFLAIRHVTGQQAVVIPALTVAFSLLSLITLWPNFALSFKRLHDANLSGMWALPYFAPLIYGMIQGVRTVVALQHHHMPNLSQGQVYFGWAVAGVGWAVAIIPALLPGRKGSNRYGPPPGISANTVASDVF